MVTVSETATSTHPYHQESTMSLNHPKPTSYWADVLEEQQSKPIQSEEDRQHLEAVKEVVRLRNIGEQLSDSWTRNAHTTGIGGTASAVDIRARAFELEMAFNGAILD